jgi:alkylation response protein AidB-like acyl-CoA dehydrogenase
MAYQAPLKDFTFLIRDVLEIDKHSNTPGFADASSDLVQQILEEGGKFAEEVIAPINRSGDQEGCIRNADGSVTTPKGWKDAWKQMVAAGWPALTSDPAYGGQGLPNLVGLAFGQMTAGASAAFSMYPGLTHGVYAALSAYGSDDQKTTYLPKMVSGEWCGTMNLTEPHCGTDLGMLRTKAVPQARRQPTRSPARRSSSPPANTTSRTTSSIWSWPASKARPRAPRAFRCSSSRRFIVNADGSLGDRNAGSCGALEHKMGIHGNATCVMAYDEAKGWLIGGERRPEGHVRDDERGAPGRRPAGPGDLRPIAYQNAAELRPRPYAGPLAVRCEGAGQEGRPDHRPSRYAPHADDHPRLQRGRPRLPAVDRAPKAQDYMALLTPVVKAYLTDRSFHAASLAMQVHGGSGYTEHFPASQYLRDCRITMIYEGANGVQALDLVGRKLAANGGRAVMTFFAELDAFVADNQANEGLKPFLDGLADTKAKLQEATFWLMQNGVQNPDNAGAASNDYLHLFGLTATAYMWALMAKAALAKAGDDDAFHAAKLTTGRYFLERSLPDAAAHLAKLKTGAGTVMALAADAF